MNAGACFSLWLAATGMAVPAPKIAVQVHLCELPAETRLPRDIMQVLKQKGADSLTFPKLITRSRKSTKASVTREFSVAIKP